jgi:hypothetical protein
MRMNNLTESARSVPFLRKTKRKVHQKRTLLCSAVPLAARRRKRSKRKRKVYFVVDLDPKCLPPHREKLMDLKIHLVSKLRKTNMKKRKDKMMVRKDSLISIASSMLLSIKSELTRN